MENKIQFSRVCTCCMRLTYLQKEGLSQFSLWITKSNSVGFVHVACVWHTFKKKVKWQWNIRPDAFSDTTKAYILSIIEQVVPSTNKPRRSLEDNCEWAASQYHFHIIHWLPFTACRLTEGTILKFPLPPGGRRGNLKSSKWQLLSCIEIVFHTFCYRIYIL